MNGIGAGIASAFVTIALIALFIGTIITGSIWYFTSDDTIESKTIITPEIKLTTDGKKIDTIYIYRNNQ